MKSHDQQDIGPKCGEAGRKPPTRVNLMGYDRRLMCHPTSIWARNHIVTLVLREGDHCHMPGAIAVARELDPEVRHIIAFSGDEPDCRYERDGDEWQAFLTCRA